MVIRELVDGREISIYRSLSPITDFLEEKRKVNRSWGLLKWGFKVEYEYLSLKWSVNPAIPECAISDKSIIFTSQIF